MKKYIALTLMGILFTVVAAGCGTNKDNVNEQGMNTNYDNGALERVGYDQNRPRDYMNVNDNNMGNTVNEDYTLSKDAANRVADLKEVDKAYVITTARNAYVAVTLNNGEKGNISKKLEDKIARQVRDVDAGLDNVYVSANPDFVDRMKGYGDKFQNGEPIKGLGDELSTTFRRVFPDRQ
ncbi:YhcN/YlaJ family sporulation lipoprotein [Lysinibacillus sphaericus]